MEKALGSWGGERGGGEGGEREFMEEEGKEVKKITVQFKERAAMAVACEAWLAGGRPDRECPPSGKLQKLFPLHSYFCNPQKCRNRTDRRKSVRAECTGSPYLYIRSVDSDVVADMDLGFPYLSVKQANCVF